VVGEILVVAARGNHGQAREFYFFAARINRGWARAFFLLGQHTAGPRTKKMSRTRTKLRLAEFFMGPRVFFRRDSDVSRTDLRLKQNLVAAT
jgi:hypothetical protein